MNILVVTIMVWGGLGLAGDEECSKTFVAQDQSGTIAVERHSWVDHSVSAVRSSPRSSIQRLNTAGWAIFPHHINLMAGTGKGKTESGEKPAVRNLVGEASRERSWIAWLFAVEMTFLVVFVWWWAWQRSREMERFRARMATDLHDDLGSQLSAISILTQVLRREVQSADPAVLLRLESISEKADDLIDTCGDLVWAVNPHRDSFSELTQRMRWFAGELLRDGSIAMQLEAPALESNTSISGETRRQFFLIFKEALHNVVQHSHATEVHIQVGIQKGRLRLAVLDNGIGFDFFQKADGNGLHNIRSRVEQIGGTWQILSDGQVGTLLVLEAPVFPHSWCRKLALTFQQWMLRQRMIFRYGWWSFHFPKKRIIPSFDLENQEKNAGTP